MQDALSLFGCLSRIVSVQRDHCFLDPAPKRHSATCMIVSTRITLGVRVHLVALKSGDDCTEQPELTLGAEYLLAGALFLPCSGPALASF